MAGAGPLPKGGAGRVVPGTVLLVRSTGGSMPPKGLTAPWVVAAEGRYVLGGRLPLDMDISPCRSGMVAVVAAVPAVFPLPANGTPELPNPLLVGLATTSDDPDSIVAWN